MRRLRRFTDSKKYSPHKETVSSPEETNTEHVPTLNVINKTTVGDISKQSLCQKRLATAVSISEFPFNKKRVRILSNESTVSESLCGGILYWMYRDVRVQDNWAFLFAQRLALKFELPLLVAYIISPLDQVTTLRQYDFLLGGLEEVEQECKDLLIPFHLCVGDTAVCLPEFVRNHKIAAVVCDFTPLREQLLCVEKVKAALPPNVPFTQVDSHNVVPLWISSDKQEFVAYFMRRRINARLNEFLTEFPPVVEHPYNNKNSTNIESIDWKQVRVSLQCDHSVEPVKWLEPGYTRACAQLQSFCVERLAIYSAKRNDPTVNALSGLSPWLHFGQISAQRCILEVMRYQSQYKDSVEAFCDEAIVHRELADNFCYYNKNYDNLKGLYPWAIKTLEEHRTDERNPTYTFTEFEGASTHDDLWNAAQMQLVREGKMHGYLRMYWAKKILEWSSSPEVALETAIYLNDKYSLDARDPNGYVGCMWSIGGLHDHGYPNRPIFGKVRYMNYNGCQRKFDVKAFIAQYSLNCKTK